MVLIGYLLLIGVLNYWFYNRDMKEVTAMNDKKVTGPSKLRLALRYLVLAIFFSPLYFAVSYLVHGSGLLHSVALGGTGLLGIVIGCCLIFFLGCAVICITIELVSRLFAQF